MTTFIRFEFPPSMSTTYPMSRKRFRQSIDMPSDIPTIQFRCDTCMQQHLSCSARKPCHQCMAEGLQCTIDGGKPVKTSPPLKISRQNLIIDTTKKTTPTDQAPIAHRKSGRPKSLVSSPATIHPNDSLSSSPLSSTNPAIAPAATTLLANIVAESEDFAVHQSPESQSHPHSQPKPRSKSKLKQQQQQQPAQPQNLKPPSLSDSFQQSTTSFPQSNSPQQPPWTNSKSDPRWSSKNATIIRQAHDLLDRLRHHHALHPGSETGLAEMRHLLQGPVYVLRAKPFAQSSSSSSPSSNENLFGANVANANGSNTAAGSKKGHPTSAAEGSTVSNARVAATMTAKLSAWIEDSKVIDEAVWILRDLKTVWRTLEGTKIPQWMLCD